MKEHVDISKTLDKIGIPIYKARCEQLTKKNLELVGYVKDLLKEIKSIKKQLIDQGCGVNYV